MDEAELKVLQEEIKAMGDEIRSLKTEKADPALIKAKIAAMLEKKKLLGDGQADQGKFVLKTPKGKPLTSVAFRHGFLSFYFVRSQA
ncbi:unnamed protein product [Cylicostephanus goldi]|uniref:WHEP-TRS domain-containing protein n=1 Tax=Cylicostephanus goldi TaxID=71465 RepID=A0A3P6UGB9_CYLGO|nr:unnamed protein product [Cylicostephanus goldi]